MPNKNYAAGRRYEYACKKKLEAEGWTVLRTAGSHGDADLVGYRVSMGGGTYLVGSERLQYTRISSVLFVQCKRSPTKADRDKIQQLCRETGLDWRLM